MQRPRETRAESVGSRKGGSRVKGTQPQERSRQKILKKTQNAQQQPKPSKATRRAGDPPRPHGVLGSPGPGATLGIWLSRFLSIPPDIECTWHRKPSKKRSASRSFLVGNWPAVVVPSQSVPSLSPCPESGLGEEVQKLKRLALQDRHEAQKPA